MNFLHMLLGAWVIWIFKPTSLGGFVWTVVWTWACSNMLWNIFISVLYTMYDKFQRKEDSKRFRGL